MQIECGIWFGTGSDMGIHQKPFIVSTIAPKSCPSSKLVLGQVVLDHKNRYIRTVTKSAQTRNSCRNEKDTQRHSEPGTPNRISARDHFSGPVSWQKRFSRPPNNKASEHQSVA